MFDQKDLISYCGQRVYQRALRMSPSLISEYEVTQDSENYLLHVNATVQSSSHYDYYDVHIVISADGNFILMSECDCPYYDTYGASCKHIALVLLEFLRRKNDLIFRDGRLMIKKLTDEPVLELLHEMTSLPRAAVSGAPVHLHPDITIVDRDSKSVSVEFRASAGSGRPYIIRSLADFANAVATHQNVRYGKSLEFVHCLEAFDSDSRELVKFLLSLNDDKDAFTGLDRSSYYYSTYYGRQNRLGRTLELKGRYLDLFMEICFSTGVNVKITEHRQEITAPFLFSSQNYEMKVHVNREEDGCSLRGPRLIYGEGYQYLYFFDLKNRIIFRNPMNRKLLPVLEYFTRTDHKPQFINEEDLPAFSRHLYPLLSETTALYNDGFNPAEFLPARPEFRIYLDLPQDDMITGELYAIYGGNKYNLLNENDSAGLRDTDEESYMKDFFCAWFSAADPQNHRMVLMDDNDRIYALLKDGIALMQEKAEVYISDRLKRLSVSSMSKVNVGISVVHDLLQLDLFSSSLTPAQLSEVMSRYDRKKKYYRLKSGEFITLNDDFEDFAEFADTMALTPAQIAKGSFQIPRFRAMTLEQLEQESEMEFTEAENYRTLIDEMKSTEELNFDIPADLKAEMRPYQKEGFRWLCALNANGFGGLLSDEMGLGKTLQAIAFMGTLKGKGRKLVVCPASLVYNWSHEIERFMPSLPHRMITGSAPVRKYQLEESGEDEILITSYDLLKRDLEEYEKMNFVCEIIDEAQYIKNSSTQAAQAVKAIHSTFRIAMTGTPIENRLSELWSIFDYLMPGFFHSYRHFRDHYESLIVKDENKTVEERLKKMIAPFVLRRLKKDVLQDLPSKLEEVYYAPLEGEQKELYTARVQNLKNTLGKQNDQEFRENRIQVLAELTRLRQICCDPSLLYDNYASNSTKKDVCIDLIRNAVDSGHKVLLFSQFTTMLDELTKALQKEGIAYHLLTGSTKKEDRSAMVEAFAEDDVPVFCISLKAGGTGLNLTAADIVIHYDPWWNTAVENQASDRAHRIGQKNVVTVYRLIMKDTIEERILQLQQEKSSLADRVLSGEGVSSSALSREDLLGLL